MAETLTIDLSEVERYISAVPERAEAQLHHDASRAGNIMANYARGNAPVRTGALQRSITHAETFDEDGVTIEVGTNSRYGAYVEFGTGDKGSAMYDGHMSEGVSFTMGWKGVRPRPYLRPALYDQEQILVDIFAQGLEGIL
jgi:HK97 gp10 family phage protein